MKFVRRILARGVWPVLLCCVAISCDSDGSEPDDVLGDVGADSALADGGEPDGDGADMGSPDAAQPDVGDDVGPPDAGPPDPPVLHIALTVHLEGHRVDDQQRFDNYVTEIREYADLVAEYGTPFSWEARNLIGPSETFGDNILLELQNVRMQSVGVHADAGGNPNQPGLTQSSFEGELADLKSQMSALGVDAEHVSGTCSHLDWVKATRDAGYTAVTGVVEYCLKSLPEDQQEARIRDCENPGQCHNPYPTTLEGRLHPWRAASGSDWTTPAEEGLLIFPTSGSVVCLAEAAEEESPTRCTFDGADIDAAIATVEASFDLLDPDRFNQLVFVWSFGQALDRQQLSRLLEQFQTWEGEGRIQWVTVAELTGLYEAFESERR